VGLPISALQIHPGAVTPPGEVTVLRPGERNTGAPKYSLNLTNLYTFDQGFLKGLRVGDTVRLAWQSIYYYYYINGVTPTVRPVPHYKPNLAAFDGIFGYQRKFRRFDWSVQGNIYNMFNRYEVKLFPNAPRCGQAGISTRHLGGRGSCDRGDGLSGPADADQEVGQRARRADL